MRFVANLAVIFGLSGCVEQLPPPPAAPSEPPQSAASDAPATDATTLELRREVRVYTGKNVGASCEVVGVLDFHSDAEAEDKGFDQLRAKAKSLGADSVIGAEFEHGHDGELSHLSGMAVRCGTGTVPIQTTSTAEASEEPSWH